MDDGDSIEHLVRQLMRDHKGVHVVVALRYLDGRQNSFVLHHSADEAECRRLIRMAWESVRPVAPSQSEVEEEAEDE